MWVTDVAGRFKHVGKNAGALFNVQQAGLLGGSMLDYIDSADILRLKALLDDAAGSRTGFLLGRYSLHTSDKDSICAEINCLPVYDRCNAHTGYLFCGRDVSNDSDVKNELMKQQLGSTVISDSPSYVISIGSDRRIIAMNRTMCDRLGYKEPEIVGKSYLSIIPPETHDTLDDVFDSLLKSGLTFIYNNPVMAKDGSVLDVEWHGRVIPGMAGSSPVIVAIGLDLKDRKRASRERRLRKEFINTLSDVTTRLVGADSRGIDIAIEASLGSIASFIDADNASIVQFSEDGNNLYASHLWRSAKKRLKPDTNKLLACDNLPLLTRDIKNGDIFCVTDVDRLPEEYAKEKMNHALGGVKASICVPMIMREDITGFISFSYIAPKDAWSESDREQIRVFAGVIANALERKRVEDILKRSEERLNTLFLSTNDGFWEYNIKNGNMFYSPRWYTMLEYEHMEFPSTVETWEQLLHPDDKAACIKHVQAFISGDSDAYFNEYRMKTKSGEWRWILSRGNIVERDADGSPLKMIGTHIDVTDLKSIRDERERLVSIIENSNEFIGMSDLDGSVTYINDAGCKMVGLESSREAVQKTIFDFVENEQLEMLKNEVMSSLMTRGYWKGQGALSHFKTGECIDVMINTFVIRSVFDNKPVAIGTVMLDLTERIRLEQQIHQSQKMDSIGRLAGGIAHDFNNLLTIIIGNTQLLSMSLPPDSELNEEVAEIRKTADRAVELTQQLLAFSRRQTARPKVVDINEILAGMDKMFRRLITENITISSDYHHELWPVRIDSGQFQQVMTNLVINARDAIEGIGTITIETGNRHLDETYAGFHTDMQAGDYVMIAVNDTGTGIAPENLTRVFEPFFTTKPRGKGTGLGLSTCYGIVRQNNGAIQVYSEVGHGTMIKIYFPRIPDAAPEIEADNEKSAIIGGRETILVVEDEKAVRKTIKKILDQLGYRVIEACDGLDALNIVKEETDPIDLVVSDVVMPNMNGRELAEKLEMIYPGISCLFISGYSDQSVVKRNLLDEDASFIQKPFSPDDLSRRIRDLLDT